MRKTALFLIIGLLVSMGISQSDKSASFKSKVPPQKQETVDVDVELGVESITKNQDGTYSIAIYMMNSSPVAGYQMDFEPDANLNIITMHGGKSEELGYLMKASENGKVLGFSMQGASIPVSSSDNLAENIIFVLIADIKADPGKTIGITLEETVIAGVGGVKLEAAVDSYNFAVEKK
ncbi:MAG: hypothetical protein HN729_11780 [Candidatus Marinimicrobia bacterium]|jgi:hypothetical protein|nr:hypothetical protein [Candidatus Neomarinimicrobiota bacterium]MBT3633859.1 hypothetical protein [Candidatus Neomarinimicrobiota bacterium]MBT3682891.1 hypothetical protein [Candidatus Neomarinimicrobiota bacterium]MBT3759922.1 hypothetical protein [Candidatus Neomarinimicrobiota bacterium]MBT3896016.1 hypothetical protein [Candidatus Neomarinimicrobiota bacterium]